MPRRTPKEKLAADLREVIADAEALVKATAGQQGEKLGAARAKAEESLKAARSWLVELEEAAEEKAKAAARAADVYVHENPWQAIGVAAALGFMLGLLARRR